MCKIRKIDTVKTETVNFMKSIQCTLNYTSYTIKLLSYNIIKNQYDSYLSRAGMRQVMRYRI